jgi:hypothetical protein
MTDFMCPHCDETTPHTIEKFCTKCEQVQPHTLMAKNKSSKDRMRPLCKKHWAEFMREQYAKNPSAWNKRSSAYKKANRKAISDQERERRQQLVLDPALGPEIRKRAAKNAAAWRMAHPEKAHASVNTYSANNKEKINTRRRDRYAEDPSKPLANIKKRKARIRGATQNDLTAAQWASILEAFNYRCVYCPPDCKDCRYKRHKLTQEHLTPLSKGGSHTVHNVVPACHSCNSRRNNKEILNPVQPILLL